MNDERGGLHQFKSDSDHASVSSDLPNIVFPVHETSAKKFGHERAAER